MLSRARRNRAYQAYHRPGDTWSVAPELGARGIVLLSIDT